MQMAGMASETATVALKFEILAELNGRWVINGIESDEPEAMAAARDLLNTSDCTAVKVVRERVGTYGREFRTVVYEQRRVQRSRNEIQPNALEGPVAPPCADLAAVFAMEGRHVIGRVLRDYLDGAVLSACELLHDHGHLRRLSNTGALLDGAVLQVALAQTRGTEETARDRAKALLDLFQEAMRRAIAVASDPTRLRIATGGLRPLLPEAAKRYQGADVGYRLRCVVAEHLSESRGWLEKFERLVKLAGDGRSAEIGGVIDPFLADLLGGGGALQSLFGSPEDLASALESMLRLARGEHDGKGTNAADVVSALGALITARGMPETRTALLGRVARSIESNVRFTRGEAKDEVAAFRRLVALLKDDKGTLPVDQGLHQAVAKRSSRWLAPETMEKLVPPPRQARERYEGLLVLERIIFGDRNKEILSGYLNELVDNPHTREILFGKSGTVLDKMRVLSKLQGKVMESELPEMLKAMVADNLDGAVLNLMLDSQLLDKVEQGENFVHRALKLLQFCRSDALTKGKSLKVVRERAQSYLKHPNFLALYTAGAKPGAERDALLRDLQSLMIDGGLL